jgi:hypothetical protein
MIEYLWPTPVLREEAPFADEEIQSLCAFAKRARALFNAGGSTCSLPDVNMTLSHQFNLLMEPYRAIAPQPVFARLQDYIDEVYRRYLREALGVRNAQEIEFVARILPVVHRERGRRTLPHYHHTCDHVLCVYLETGSNRKPFAERERSLGDGELILCDPRPMASFPFWEKTRFIDPFPGLAILHPAPIWHETNTFTSEGSRTLLAITLRVTSHNYTDLYRPLKG